MVKTWYVVGIAKVTIIFRGISFYPNKMFKLCMTDDEFQKIKDDIEILEYRENLDLQSTQNTKSEPVIQENSKGEENAKLSNGTNKNKNKAKVSKS